MWCGAQHNTQQTIANVKQFQSILGIELKKIF